jgi:hypothetical protein
MTIDKMNQSIDNIEQKTDDKIEPKQETTVLHQNQSKRIAKLEQDTLLRNERLNASGNDRLSRELQKNEIKREKQAKPRGRKPKTPVLRNENGIKLTKDGKEDKRSLNYYNGPLYKSILARKKEQTEPTKKIIYTPIVESDSDSDVEFDIVPEVQPQATKSATASISPDYQAQLQAMELENKKLKDDFHFNSHLNRISLSARSMKLKF